MTEMNIWAVLVCAGIAQGLGFLWYGKLFGKAYMKVIGGRDMSQMSKEECDEINKKMVPVYILNFVTSIITIVVLAYVFNHYLVIGAMEGIKIALLMWVGFIMPMTASAAMWSGKPKQLAWNMFFITAGYELVAFIIFGAILGAWM